MLKSHSTPTKTYQNFIVVKEDKMSNVSYQAAVASLLFAPEATKLNTAFSISLICYFCNNPQKSHWAATKCILR